MSDSNAQTDDYVVRFNVPNGTYSGKQLRGKTVQYGQELRLGREEAEHLLLHHTRGNWLPVNEAAQQLLESKSAFTADAPAVVAGPADEEQASESTDDVQSERRACRHIKDDGERCKMPPLQGKDYCGIHRNLYEKAEDESEEDEGSDESETDGIIEV